MKRILMIALTALLLLAACGRKDPELPPAMYYWRTTFALSGAERQALRDYGVGRLYVRMFDVVAGEDRKPRPEGSLRFSEPWPEGVEAVPVVFIDRRVFPAAEPDTLAQLIVKRVGAMAEHNGLPAVKELQLDCDWTPSTRASFFRLAERATELMHERGAEVSSTIRLHQLAQDPPPVDRGVLMVYNTGNFKDAGEPNSILTEHSIEPFMKYLKGYPLPLSTALPVYCWDLVFAGPDFRQICRIPEPDDTTLYRALDRNHLLVKSYHSVPSPLNPGGENVRLYPGNTIRREGAPYAILMGVKQRLAKERPGAVGSVVLYHLDENSLKCYKIDEIKELLDGGR